MANKTKLQTRLSARGYREYLDSSTGRWVSTHRRVAEKKLGELPHGYHVHHIDGDKTNNRPENLVVVHPKIHGRLHAHPGVCLTCGRNGHWARACRESTFWDDKPL